MNKFIGTGRLVHDPEVRYSQGKNGEKIPIVMYTLAIDRKIKKEGTANADFIHCIVFGKSAEFAEKYLKKGTKITIVGHIQTGSYTDKNGQKAYTTDIIVDEQEFVESKKEESKSQQTTPEFVNIPQGIEAELPFR